MALRLKPHDNARTEVTGSELTIICTTRPHVAAAVLGRAKQPRAIDHARVITKKVDARTLADLIAADLIPEAWMGDKCVRALNRLVFWRRCSVICRHQVRNEASAVLHRGQQSLPSIKKCVVCAEDR